MAKSPSASPSPSAAPASSGFSALMDDLEQAVLVAAEAQATLDRAKADAAAAEKAFIEATQHAEALQADLSRKLASLLPDRLNSARVRTYQS